MKFLGKFTKKNWGGVGRGVRCGSGWWGGGGGQGGCVRRIEVFVKIQKKMGGGVGGGRGWVGGVGLGVSGWI